jgi:hypothetical protein
VAHPLPGGWEPDSEAVELAQSLRLSVTHEASQFVDHARAKGLVNLDWQAAFRKWCRGSRDTGKATSKARTGTTTAAPEPGRMADPLTGVALVERDGEWVPDPSALQVGAASGQAANTQGES